MPLIKFANIIFERNPRSVSYPSLYCISDEVVIDDQENKSILLYGKGTYDFTTYFNSLSVQKLKEFTSATKFFLHLELKGSPCTIRQTYGDPFSSAPQEITNSEISITKTTNEWQIFDIELSIPKNSVLVGFKIETEGRAWIHNSYYSVEIPHELNQIELFLSTTTFKKEDFIYNNIEIIKHAILESTEPISRHFTMHISDNAKSLDPEQIESANILLTRNENVGGAGGFACGMIKALEQSPQPTHILLMDDDVAISPESIIRTYNLLTLLNSEYKNAFISGAMLDYEAGDEQWEDIGYMTPQGTFSPIKPSLRLSKFENVIFNETFKIQKNIRDLHQTYAAWWYCCIPMEIIKQNGLPLPVFVRCDDAEYGVRCQPKFITMNALCIWHMSFHSRYNAAVERYQTTRNTLVAQHTTGFSPNSDFLNELDKNIHLELKKFGYKNAELCLDAFEDFLKGPDFISKPGIAEDTFIKANKNKEKLVSFDILESEMHEIGFTDFNISEITRQLIDSDIPRSFAERLQDYFTDNNQKLFANDGSGYAVIPEAGWIYPAGVIRGKQYLVVIDWHNRLGAIRKKDSQQYKNILKRYKNDLNFYKKHKTELTQAYKSVRDKLISIDYWKEYLRL